MKETAIGKLKISSEAFENNEYIPLIYTCEGKNINPPLRIQNIPVDTESLAIIVDDPDAPAGIFTHWMVWNIYPTSVIEENSFPEGTEGINDYTETKYMGPCPPSGTHRYFFKVYALDAMLDIEKISTKANLERVMQEHILAYGELIGLYQKTKVE
ncbi:MAG TPA: YbhB/YbcL family Raf kinase inhibitor-like protein [Cytophagaceae bacterium]|nr:YbhB/YbcL family Raf kinase inhibitor-like protein [Cytophagaceae bacterium]